MSAGDIRTSRVELNANEAGNQQPTPKRTPGGPILDSRLAVAESQLGRIEQREQIQRLLIGEPK